MASLDDIVLIEIGKPGIAGTGITGPEVAQIQSDLAALQSRLDNIKSTDLTDTSLPPRYDGNVIAWDSATNTWVSRAFNEAVRYVKGNQAVVLEHADRLSFNAGLVVVVDGTLPTQGNVAVAFGGTGSANTASRSDHSHNPSINKTYALAPTTPSLSSGTRTLTQVNVGPFLIGVEYQIIAIATAVAKNDINNGTFDLSCQMGSSPSFPAAVVPCPTVGGVPVSFSSMFVRTYTVTDSYLSLNVSATFTGGDPSDILSGQVAVLAVPRQ